MRLRHRWAWGIGLGVVFCGALFLWLYSHKLWSSTEEQRLDSLLHHPALPKTAETDTSSRVDSLAPEPAQHPEWLESELLPALWGRARSVPPPCSRCIAIALIGVDSRLTDPTAHADANHVVLIDPSSGRITIVAIPRDTPADAGFPDTSRYNKLANVRAQRGLKAHLATLAELIGIPEIHYYAEFGFSQAFALLRLLRFGNPTEVLRVLRARTGIWGDDYHRVYVQAQFIRQQLLRWFDSYNTPWGLALLRGTLGIVNTNLTVGVLTRLADTLRARGFPADSNAVSIVVYGVPLQRVPVYDFGDPRTFAALAEKLRRFYRHHHPGGSDTTSHEQRVHAVLAAALDRAQRAAASGRPTEVVRLLSPLVRQRAWWQLSQADARSAYRTAYVELLSHAYERLGKPRQAEFLRTEFLQRERELEELVSTP
ncbi:hypothetical protein HRbin21_01267 [bacterium HR21]|nr:hypothetical protein HRbin21_01267 [bacterium HR21]